LAALCTISGAAKAEFDASRLWINAEFYSAHFDTNQGLSNANPGIDFEYRIDETWSAKAGLSPATPMQTKAAGFQSLLPPPARKASTGA
jgi:hypothetical protein